MSLEPSELLIERLRPEDAPQNVALSRSVGWKDVESEWQVLHAAAEVCGVRSGGRVVAQGALGSYGNAASLAKMVVASELRGRRLGGRLLDGFLQRADALGVPVGLAATEEGRPLYTSRGFHVSGELVILHGSSRISGMSQDPSAVASCDVEHAIDLDRRLSGCDRQRMLRARFAVSSARLQLTGAARGFALATEQGEVTLVGPILADTDAGALSLAAALLTRIPGPVRIDVPLEHHALRSWLVSVGLREVAQRVEMTRGAPRSPWQVPQRFALSTQAWG